MATEPKLPIPSHLRRGLLRYKEQESIESGRKIIEHFLDVTGWESLAGRHILDIGCGVKLAQAIVEYDVDIGSYTGLDIFPDMIDFLSGAVAEDERFRFVNAPYHNELYNPQGEPLGPDTVLPLDGDEFDAVWSFSVFTHLNPADADHMMRLVRQGMKPDGLAYFTAFVDRGTRDDFRDAVPEQPLKVAVFSETAFMRLVENNGLQPIRYREPEEVLQHQLLCRVRGEDEDFHIPEIEHTEFTRVVFTQAIEQQAAADEESSRQE